MADRKTEIKGAYKSLSKAHSFYDGLRSEFTFWQFFQFYFPEVESVYKNRKYGYNLRSQLLKLLGIFPVVSAIAAWVLVTIF